ncbi:hypothetical protein ACROYT_G011807 [Oculina patagonica]
MENFWFPEPVKAMLMQYYNNFQMRFTTDGFTTDWQRLEVGIAAGCTISDEVRGQEVKDQSCSFVKGKQKEIRFSVAGDTIPTVREQPVKSLGWWYKGSLTDRLHKAKILKQAEEGLKTLLRLDYLESSRCGVFSLDCTQD